MGLIPESIKRMSITIIVLVILSLVFVVFFNPSSIAQREVPNIIGKPITVVYDDIPCMINCLTNLQGSEVSYLTAQPFLSVGKSPVLIEWFPCNQDILTIAYLINEMARWDYVSGEYVRTVNSGYSVMKQLLYDCITNPDDNPKCYSRHMTFSNFCSLDSFLYNYNFLPCSSDNSFIDYFNKAYLSFASRTGRDIDNDFICDKSIGRAYSPNGYFLCSSESDVKYDEGDCWPSWMILKGQEQLPDGSRDLSYGRCEDFALLYYSLFRAIDVPASDMSFNLGSCKLPCPCQELVNDYGLASTLKSCYVPAALNINGFNSINACDDVNDLPDAYGGSFVITASDDDYDYYWVINQDFSSSSNYYAPAFRSLTLDDDFSDDTGSMIINGVTYSSVNIIADSHFVASQDGYYFFNPNTNALITFYNHVFNLNDGSQSDLLPVDNSLGINARYGFKININSLNNCVNDSVIIELGFLSGDSPSSSFCGDDSVCYTLKKGSRGVLYRGKITGKPYFRFIDLNGDQVTTSDFGSKDDWDVSCDNGVSCSFVSDSLSCSGADCSYDDVLKKIVCDKGPVNNGWVDESSSDCRSVVSSNGGYYDVISLYDNNANGKALTYRLFSDVDTTISFDYYPSMYLSSSINFMSGSDSLFAITFDADNNDINFNNQSIIKLSNSYSNQWYHFSIMLDFDNDLCDVFINGVKVKGGLSFSDDFNELNKIILKTSNAGVGVIYADFSKIKAGVSQTKCSINTCDVSFSITNSNTGVIPDDPCYNSYGFKSKSELISECDAFISTGSKILKSDNSIQESNSIGDFLN